MGTDNVMTRDSSILVTGGAGYIGSHTVLQLAANGERVVVLDDLSTGFRQSVRDIPLVVGNVGDRALVEKLLAEHRVDTIIHFAAHTIVPESVADPLKYYGNNTCATRALLDSAKRAGVRNFVFSSTAAVYGIPADGVASEDSPTRPINPYGTSKLMSEWMLRDLCSASPLRSVILRYFNVAGSDTQGRIGQSTRAATLLVKVACEVAVGKRPHLSVYGTDYPTPDGTCIRDYIHIADLVTAHLLALEGLRERDQLIYNLVSGNGFSVREVIETAREVTAHRIPAVENPRRLGDSAILVASSEKIKRELGWKPQHDNLHEIVTSAWAWHKWHPKGYTA